MGKILIYEDIEREILNRNLEKDLTLFGERNLISDENFSFDVIFHYKYQNPKNSRHPTSIVMPVFQPEKSREDELKVLSYMNQNYPLIKDFAFADNEKTYFYHSEKKGKKFVQEYIENSSTVNRQSFLDLVKDHPELTDKIKQRTRLIDTLYSSDLN